MQTLIIRTNVNTNENYDVYGNSFRGGSPRFVVNSKMRVEWRLYSNTPNANEDTVDVSTWTAFTGYSGCSAKLGCDDDWIHRVTGTYTGESIAAGGTLTEVTATISGASETAISESGLVTLYNSNGQFETFLYTARTISGETVVFDLDGSVTCTYAHASGESMNATQELLFQTAMNASVSDTAHGVFVFDVITTSRKLQQKVDTANSGIIAIQGVELLPFKVNGTETEQQPSIFLDTAVLETTMQEAGMPAPVTDPVSDQIGAEAAAIIGTGFGMEVTSNGGATWQTYSGGDTNMGRTWIIGAGSANKTEFPLIPGATGAAAGFGTPTASATSLPAGSTPSAAVTASGQDTAKVFNFTFEIPAGEPGDAAGFGTPTASATSLPAGSTPTASVSASGTDTAKVFAFSFGIPDGKDGADGEDGQLIGASLSVSSLTSGYIVVSSDAAPVMLKTNLGNLYPVEKGTMTESSGTWSIDPAAYLAYDNVQTFTGPWIVYFAGGLPEVMTIIGAGTSITPLEHQVYKHTLAASDAITIDTSGLTSSQCLTFELWLDMPSTAVTFTLPAGITWLDGTSPDFSAGDTRYVIVIRWNGTGLLANLAYTEALA